jgi:hypothetical protein
MLAIASHHLGQPEQTAIYFNQSLLEDPGRNKENDLTNIMGRAEAGFSDREMSIEMGGVGTRMEMVAPGRADVPVGMANEEANGET